MVTANRIYTDIRVINWLHCVPPRGELRLKVGLSGSISINQVARKQDKIYPLINGCLGNLGENGSVDAGIGVDAAGIASHDEANSFALLGGRGSVCLISEPTCV